jgi:hypothetical protein
MQARFFSAMPHSQARNELDDVLRNGVDQLSIACAFLTPGGAQALLPHARNLTRTESFLVVATDWPTDLEALSILHKVAPNHLYTHLGYLTPKEKRVGPGLMHSKVFFARKGAHCWLWVGSHNLTTSAMHGANCEAAVIMEGTMEEDIFQDALEHLYRCRDEAVLFDPAKPIQPPKPRDTLVIHAESHDSVKAPSWYVHLYLPTTAYDKVVRPPASVWLYLYPPGSLKRGQPRPEPTAVYSGAITALNYTENHPESGISATWEDADYVIRHEGVFKLVTPTIVDCAMTQCIIRIDSEADETVEWVTESPVPQLERIVGERWATEIDPVFARFFTADSIEDGRLIFQRYDRQRRTVRIPEHEVAAQTRDTRLGLPDDVELVLDLDERTDDISTFLYRAKFPISRRGAEQNR